MSEAQEPEVDDEEPGVDDEETTPEETDETPGPDIGESFGPGERDVDPRDDPDAQAPEDAPLLELDGVDVHYSDAPLSVRVLPQSLLDRLGWQEHPVKAVTDVDLDVDDEDVVALVGESGSGKTTLGRTAIGLQEPTDGEVRYKGYDIEAVENGEFGSELRYEQVRKGLQIIHQDSSAALNPYRTIRSTLSEPLKLWYPELDLNDRYERMVTMLRTTGVTPAEEYIDRYPHELSGGEKQRVAIIRAMLVEPELILADEVVSALDVSLRIDIMDLLMELQELFGTSYIFISHNLTNARYLAAQSDGEIAVMYLGNIVERGPAREVIEEPKHPYTQILKWASLPLDPDAARATIEEESPIMMDGSPDPEHPPSGCRFHEACPKARVACTEEKPEMLNEDGDEDHTAMCFREDPNHAYWNSEPYHEEGEVAIPGVDDDA